MLSQRCPSPSPTRSRALSPTECSPIRTLPIRATVSSGPSTTLVSLTYRVSTRLLLTLYVIQFLGLVRFVISGSRNFGDPWITYQQLKILSFTNYFWLKNSQNIKTDVKTNKKVCKNVRLQFFKTLTQVQNLEILLFGDPILFRDPRITKHTRPKFLNRIGSGR